MEGVAAGVTIGREATMDPTTPVRRIFLLSYRGDGPATAAMAVPRIPKEGTLTDVVSAHGVQNNGHSRARLAEHIDTAEPACPQYRPEGG
jgi:hypothetical protein